MSRRLAAFLLVLAPLTVGISEAQSSGRYHLVKSTSGSRGAPDGNRFLIEDPRVVFRAGQDRQVLVVFEWQGPAGPHKCTGLWKDPAGRLVFTSEASVNARTTRFGIYWGLSLPDTVATGTWVVEALVDGEAAGAHAFQITAEREETAATPARRALATAELYRHGLAETLTLEAVGPSGASLGTTSGFFVSPDLVSTSFSGINAARSVRLVTSDQKRIESSEVVAWNRRDDWAVLRFAGAGGPRHAARAPSGLSVGDRCFFLEAQRGGGRIIVETTVVGQSKAGDLTLAQPADEASNGGPVLNEYGEVAATLANDGIFGASVLDAMGLGDGVRRAQVRGGRARPLVAVPDADTAAKTLQDLEQAGLFVRPVIHSSHFVSGILGTGMDKRGPVPMATDQRTRFSRKDAHCLVFVTWNPGRKEDTTSRFELFDEEGRRLTASEDKKLRLRQGEQFVQYWEIALPGLKPGIYRVDVLAGADPMWRTFFRLDE